MSRATSPTTLANLAQMAIRVTAGVPQNVISTTTWPTTLANLVHVFTRVTAQTPLDHFGLTSCIHPNTE